MAQSWIVTCKETGEAIMETWSPEVAAKVNRLHFKVETAADYLARINREIKAGSKAYNG